MRFPKTSVRPKGELESYDFTEIECFRDRGPGSIKAIMQEKMKQAILATVVDVKRKCPDSVVVLLRSEELSGASDVISTGLNGEQSHKNAGSGLEVICKGDPRAETGDKVPVVLNREQDSP
jgi:hypothetical protein